MSDLPLPGPDKPDRIVCGGHCRRCGRTHVLREGGARRHARALMTRLDAAGRLDFDVPEPEADPKLSLRYLWGSARGQMFGVLACRDASEGEVVLKAFSGLYDGVWEVDGWAPPLVDPVEFARVGAGPDRIINELGRRIAALEPDDPSRRGLELERREISRRSMRALHALYAVPNFRGETASLFDAAGVDPETAGVPMGTGDCCAPKLLAQAARLGLRPTGLAEFYWGLSSRSGMRRHKRYYASCADKCGRILGHLLCGLEDSA